ncbi:PP2C family protein-serine/threonine phosphatase [Treponema saccharophilum]|uniref:Protein serine/threonine phosphatase with extracellular sensor n=2 Tax=Treponema saccharophilum TaxID=165 RepID=H7EIG8_9SPIR|nr:SpoIIE family protein phosphatase [Treponema saccharophilum]EIC02619.1 protein serine/threonine phosphatase with extracellular sensor [Treponema saccharophilum DSM 2985]BDC96184.1 hypothetical protein TRSA_12830 [Treponema saccharophilum]
MKGTNESRARKIASKIAAALAALTIAAALSADIAGIPAGKRQLYWEKPRAITKADSRFPQAVSCGGRMTVFFEEIDSANNRMWISEVSRNEGELSWGEPRRISPPIRYAGEVPDILSAAAREDGTVALAAQSSPGEITVYTSGGGDFTESKIDCGGKEFAGGRIFATARGTFMIFASLGDSSARREDGFFSIYAAESADGKKWSPLSPFGAASGISNPFVPTLAPIKRDGRKTDAVVFQGIPSGELTAGSVFQLFYAERKEDGSWENAAAITSGAGYRNQRPALAFEDDGKGGGNVLVSWERTETTSDSARIVVAEISGGMISDAEELTSRGDAHRPTFFENGGKTALVWFDDRKGTDGIYMATKNGFLWTEETLSETKTNSRFAFPLVMESEIAFAWEDDSGEQGRITVLETDRSCGKPEIIAESFRKGERSTSEKAAARVSLPDDSSGIAGFTWIWTQDEDEEPPKDASKLVLPGKKHITSYAGGDGIWFFKARALDNAGNWSEPASLRYWRDLTPPLQPVIKEVAEDEFGFAQSNDFTIEWEDDERDDDIAGYSWNITPIGVLDKTLMVNKTHPLRVPGATVEKRVSDMVLRYTKERELQKWDKKSRPPRKMMGQRKSASFRNHENGLFIFSVCAIDKVGNIGEPADYLIILNKYQPQTKILGVTQKTDEFGTVSIAITGEGFLYDGTISEVALESEGRSYRFTKKNGLVVASDSRIEGISLPDMKAGTYRITVTHTDRGKSTWKSRLVVTKSGIIKHGNRYFFEAEWKKADESAGGIGFGDLALVLVASLLVMSTIAAARGLTGTVRQMAEIKGAITAIMGGEKMPIEKKEELRQAFGRRGISLKAKLFLFTTILVISIVSLVAVSLGRRLSDTQEMTLAKGLQERVDVVMESISSGVRTYLPEGLEKSTDIATLPNQTAYFSEADFATVTGLPNSGENTNIDYVWASNDPGILSKIDSKELNQGSSRLSNPDERIFSIIGGLNKEAVSQVSDISAGIAILRAEMADEKTTDGRREEISRTTTELYREIERKLNELSSDASGSVPPFSTQKLDRSQRTYTFYKPVLYRQSGDEETFVRALVMMQVSTEELIESVDRARRDIFIIAVVIAIIAIIIGDIAAFALASVIVNPIRRLVLHVKKIGETADKEELDGEEIEIKSRDEIRTLGDAVNDMTRGLVKAAKDEKIAAKIREENIRTREEAARAQAEAAEAQARVLEEQEKALEAQKMNMDGKAVQNALIPLNAGRDNKQTTASYRDKEIDLFCYYEGSDDVSGDFFDYKKLDDRWYAVIKCDVSGHGIPAALLVAVIATIFREYFSDWSFKKNGTRINELAGKLNEFIGNLGLRGKFATLLIGLFDSKNDDVYLCHAGDRIVRVFDAEKKQQKTIELDSATSGMPAAGQIEQWMVDMKGGYQVRKFKLRKNDILFLYTDGIEEAQSYFKDEHFRNRKCGEKVHLDKDGKHINHMPDEEYEEFGNDRIKEIVECVFNRRKYTLKRCHPQNPSESLEFDLSACTGSTEDMILALASIEKVFRMYKKPDARGNVTKDDKGNIRIDGDGIRVDRKIDEFLSRTFSGYDFYCRDKMDMGEQNYLYYINVNEDKQADDLTIYAIKNL